jgi:hypothetical protein
MSVDQRRKNVSWPVAEADGQMPTWERAGIAVLMDIRDELQRLNAAIYCVNCQAIPRQLARIARNTAKPRKTARRTAP